jgi:hypothetical protein
MKSTRAAMAVAVIGMTLSACGDDSPTSPEASIALTQLHIEPNTPTSDVDPRGFIAISVLPGEVGGTVTIEVCSDGGGQPMPGDFAIDLIACERAGGQWTIAIDSQGRSWEQRELAGSAIVRFDREHGQDALLFRSSYRAPGGGISEDVGLCPWVLADGVDVGVLCTSDDEVRLLPVVRSGYGATASS